MIYQNILETIGNTPIVKLNTVIETKAKNLWVKLESFNPGGSIKDRPALNMIVQAEKRGDLQQNDIIVEPTSGNTGIGLAMVASCKGYKTLFIMPESMSIERRNILKAFGAELILTPKEKGMKGAIAEAEQLASKEGYFMPSQFNNFDNSESHKTTAEEIWKDTDGNIDCVIFGTGTGGTISGTGKYLREKKPNIKIIATEPADSPVLSGGQPSPHKIQGMGAGFIPKIMNTQIYDEIVQVKTEDAYAMTTFLARKEGIFVGISSGAVSYALLELGKRDEYTGKNLLAILPDTGERYLSSELWTNEK